MFSFTSFITDAQKESNFLDFGVYQWGRMWVTFLVLNVVIN